MDIEKIKIIITLIKISIKMRNGIVELINDFSEINFKM